MLRNFVGHKCRIVVMKNNQVEIDMIIRKLDRETVKFFNQYKFVSYHKTQITELNVIELVKEE